MTESWEFYQCMMGEARASVFLDIGIRPEIPISDKVNLTRVVVDLKNPRVDGLSSELDFNELKAFEDEISVKLNEVNAIYVGRITVENKRYYYFYSSNFNLDEIINNYCQLHGFKFETQHRLDKKWDGYIEELYPSDDDWQWIKDLRVTDQLKKHGDDLKIERDIDHLIYFKSNDDGDLFLNAVSGIGLTVKERSHSEDQGYSIHLIQRGVPSFPEITFTTIKLNKIARKFNGEYDGWGCNVEKG